MTDYTFDKIDRKTFDALLEQYPSYVPDKLKVLEEQRFHELPRILAKRNADDKAYLTKDEVAVLVDWKLAHGTFRPSLKALVQKNDVKEVLKITTAGFAQNSQESQLKTLSTLSGIGPATASLLLAVSDPETTPFFSDELFRWAFWTDEAGCRWDRKIKYTSMEYRELVARVGNFRRRFEDRGAVEVEKVAYVLGTREQDLASTSQESFNGGQVADEAEEKPVKKRTASSQPEHASSEVTAKSRKLGKPAPSGNGADVAKSATAPRRSSRKK